jgi:hypothetical protein
VYSSGAHCISIRIRVCVRLFVWGPYARERLCACLCLCIFASIRVVFV